MASNNRVDLLTAEQISLRKKMLLTAALSLLSLYSLLCFVLAPLGESLSANVSYSESVLVGIVGYLCTLCELMALTVFYAVQAYCLYRFGLKHFKGGLVLFGVATAYKYMAHKIVSWIRYGAVPSNALADLGDVIFFVFLEAVQLTVILLLSCRILNNFKLENAVMKQIGKGRAVYPFGKLIDRKNPLMHTAFLTSVVVFITKFIGQPLSDLVYILMSGLPKDPDTLPTMLLSYLTTLIYALIYGALCYVVQLLILSKLLKKHGAF